ncbi:MAG: hypothetical protein ACXWAT_16205 [Methylobacter sp.]
MPTNGANVRIKLDAAESIVRKPRLALPDAVEIPLMSSRVWPSTRAEPSLLTAMRKFSRNSFTN